MRLHIKSSVFIHVVPFNVLYSHVMGLSRVTYIFAWNIVTLNIIISMFSHNTSRETRTTVKSFQSIKEDFRNRIRVHWPVNFMLVVTGKKIFFLVDLILSIT
jgi:hypothetical protein